MPEELTLEDMTKAELIKVIKERFFRLPSHKDLAFIRWRLMTDEAEKLCAESVATSKALKEITDDITRHKKWLASQQVFDKGLAIYDKANKFHKKHLEAK